MPVDASPGDFESALKPLWLRAQSGDDAAYRQCLGLLAATACAAI
jgi:RNA polymerase sigma-70 factor (ECF subfamily)